MKKLTVRKKLLVIIFAILIFGTILAYVYRENIYSALNSLRELGYFGVFLLSLLGATSIMVPIPYTVVLLTISASGQFNPLLLAIAASLGAAIGELSGYGLGYYSRKYLNKKYWRRFDAIVKLLNYRYYGPIAVFIFALLPLPDDLLFIPLGLVRYSVWKVLVPCLLGKFSMSLIIVYVGLGVGQSIDESPIFAIIIIILLALIIIAMFKIDWEKVIKKYLPKRRR